MKPAPTQSDGVAQMLTRSGTRKPRTSLAIAMVVAIVLGALGTLIASAPAANAAPPPGWDGVDTTFSPSTATPCAGPGGRNGTIIKWVPLILDGAIHDDSGSGESVRLLITRTNASGRTSSNAMSAVS